MKLAELAKDISFRTGIKVIFQITLIVLLASNLLLSVSLAKADRTHRETLIPPVVTKTFWVEDSKVSAEYLEQMGLFILQLALNVTPHNAEFNSDILLRYVAPASYGEFGRVLAANASRLKRNNASMFFIPQAITTDEDSRAVMFSGIRKMFITDKKVEEVQKYYLVRFGYSGGRIYVVEVRETDPRQPFEDVPVNEQSVDDLLLEEGISASGEDEEGNMQ